MMTTTWFSRLTGFAERSWMETQAQLVVEGQALRSLVNGRSFAIGTLDTPSLADLRARALDTGAGGSSGRLRVSAITADVTALQRDAANHGAVFQVASQFNLLEMTGPDVTPENGVSRLCITPRVFLRVCIDTWNRLSIRCAHGYRRSS